MGEKIVVQCQSSSQSICKPCGERYRRRVSFVARSGVPDDPKERWFLITLTAPGDGLHCTKHKECAADGVDCEACSCTPAEGVRLGVWNRSFADRFNRWVQSMRREFGEFEYFKSTEFQKRGAIHPHMLVRCPINLVKAVKKVRALAIHHGFGHRVDVRWVHSKKATEISRELSNARAAGYVVKYVAKEADRRDVQPWADDEGNEQVANPRLRKWTASRRWGLRMREVRRAQREWWRTLGDPDGGGIAQGAEPPLVPSSSSYTEVVSTLMDDDW